MSESDVAPKMKVYLRRIIRSLASLKLAVVVILSIATLVAVGTFVEAKYDATAAKKLVYDTIWMNFIMGFLAVNLIAVMVDRWPWKARHTSFVLAHIGILVLMLGSIITGKFGLDGSVRVGIGQSEQYVVVPETDVLVYSSFDGDRYTKLAEQNVDFFLKRPTAQKPFIVPGYNTEIKITDYKPYVVPARKVTAPKEPNGRRGAGLRFQLQNANIKVNVIEWLVQKRPTDIATHSFGPASVHLGPAPEKGRGENEIYFTPNGTEGLKYVVFQKDTEKPLKTGSLKEGEVFVPGWKMPIEIRALRYLPEAEEDWDLQEREAPTPLTTSAVKIEFNNQENWILLNDTVKLFGPDVVYIVSYGNRRIDLGFPIKLNQFKMDRYQGTNRAMEYSSRVEVPDMPEQLISMNEPLKYRGYTIYQASFENAPNTEEPVASIFSVNQDPGRWLKYLGSLIISLGIVMLFYFKKKAKKGNPT
ncbi:cytochrome c biogenesis protein ResB [Bdellovibrio sp. HCB337]|uniref:cytochrome c biogenesis protein ResB n=1 Tax=Bdellovibrio sp. HCB337 TaxID=3394358 RepID=UPI0039A50A97